MDHAIREHEETKSSRVSPEREAYYREERETARAKLGDLVILGVLALIGLGSGGMILHAWLWH